MRRAQLLALAAAAAAAALCAAYDGPEGAGILAAHQQDEQAALWEQHQQELGQEQQFAGGVGGDDVRFAGAEGSPGGSLLGNLASGAASGLARGATAGAIRAIRDLRKRDMTQAEEMIEKARTEALARSKGMTTRAAALAKIQREDEQQFAVEKVEKAARGVGQVVTLQKKLENVAKAAAKKAIVAGLSKLGIKIPGASTAAGAPSPVPMPSFLPAEASMENIRRAMRASLRSGKSFGDFMVANSAQLDALSKSFDGRFTAGASGNIPQPSMTDYEVCIGCHLALNSVLEHTDGGSELEDVVYSLHSACHDQPPVMTEACGALMRIDSQVANTLALTRDTALTCNTMGLCYNGLLAWSVPRTAAQKLMGRK